MNERKSMYKEFIRVGGLGLGLKKGLEVTKRISKVRDFVNANFELDKKYGKNEVSKLQDSEKNDGVTAIFYLKANETKLPVGSYKRVSGEVRYEIEFKGKYLPREKIYIRDFENSRSLSIEDCDCVPYIELNYYIGAKDWNISITYDINNFDTSAIDNLEDMYKLWSQLQKCTEPEKLAEIIEYLLKDCIYYTVTNDMTYGEYTACTYGRNSDEIIRTEINKKAMICNGPVYMKTILDKWEGLRILFNLDDDTLCQYREGNFKHPNTKAIECNFYDGTYATCDDKTLRNNGLYSILFDNFFGKEEKIMNYEDAPEELKNFLKAIEDEHLKLQQENANNTVFD